MVCMVISCLLAAPYSTRAQEDDPAATTETSPLARPLSGDTSAPTEPKTPGVTDTSEPAASPATATGAAEGFTSAVEAAASTTPSATSPAESATPAAQATTSPTEQPAQTGETPATPETVVTPASPPPEEEDFGPLLPGVEWSGYLKNETAYRMNKPRSITKILNKLSITGHYAFNSHYALTATGLAYYDLAYDFYDYDIIADRYVRDSNQPLAFIFNLQKEKDVKGFDMRELYFDMNYDKLDIRLGRQFVVWGVLEGVRIVDEVNPVDFRELIMPDLLDSRIPEWTAKVDYYHNSGTLELLMIPDVRFNKPAPPGSEWELLQNVPGTIRPKNWTFQNAEYGVKYSTSLFDADVSFSYLYTWDDFPTVFRRIRINVIQTPEFYPTYSRIGMWGTTFSRLVDGMVLKGEAAFVTGKYFAIVNADRNRDGYLDNLGEEQRNHVRWGLGLEFNWMGMDISPGIVQWVVLQHDPAMVIDQFDTSLNLFIRKEYPQESMLFELLFIDFVNFNELYLNPRWTFRITDRFSIQPGFNFFSGKKTQFGVLANPNGAPTEITQRSQFIGNFHDNNRLYINFKYAF
jgi:hypothetical protein